MAVEIIRGPVMVFVADPSTAQPEISSTDAAVDALPAWTKLGKSLSDDGLAMSFTDEEEDTTTLDSPMVKDINIVSVGLEYTVSLVDMTVETFARVQNGVAVSEQEAGAGAGGYHEMKLGYGFQVKYYAVLCRGRSPYATDMNHQVYLPKARVKVSEGPTLAKSGDAMIGAMIRPVYDETLEALGTYRAQDAAPTSG